LFLFFSAWLNKIGGSLNKRHKYDVSHIHTFFVMAVIKDRTLTFVIAKIIMCQKPCCYSS
jgi:hypothetical protein